MSEAAIKAAVVARLQAVDNVGRVHSYERYARLESTFKDLYGWSRGDGTKQLRGWFVRRTARAELSPMLGRRHVQTTFALRGYLALDDEAATEQQFDALIDDVITAFRNDETLGGLVNTTVTPEGAGAQLVQSEPVLFCGVLCHSARLTLICLHDL